MPETKANKGYWALQKRSDVDSRNTNHIVDAFEILSYAIFPMPQVNYLTVHNFASADARYLVT